MYRVNVGKVEFGSIYRAQRTVSSADRVISPSPSQLAFKSPQPREGYQLSDSSTLQVPISCVCICRVIQDIHHLSLGVLGDSLFSESLRTLSRTLHS